jgi:phosphate starvation-inducible PhoH-like protein
LTQIDLPNPKRSGLFEALRVLDGVEGIAFCHFEEVDVVRHCLVQRIVRAYDSYGRAQQMPLELGDAGIPAAGMDAAEAAGTGSKLVSKPQ